jgi:hypothetical protein
MVLANPHHFIVGAGYGALVAKLILYCNTPKALWSPLMDMLSSQSVPSFRGMAKACWHGRPPDRTIASKIDRTFFSDYNPFIPLPDQPSLGGFEGIFAPINTEHMKQVREQLRSQGLTITRAFTALCGPLHRVVIDHTV